MRRTLASILIDSNDPWGDPRMLALAWARAARLGGVADAAAAAVGVHSVLVHSL